MSIILDIPDSHTKVEFIPILEQITGVTVIPTTRKSTFDVRSSQVFLNVPPLLWIETEPVNVTYGYRLNQYKPDSGEGSITVSLTENDYTRIQTIEDSIVCQLQERFLGKTIGSLYVSNETIQKMFKRSDGNLKVVLTDDMTMVFNSNLSEIPFTFIKTECVVSIIIEPAFLWIMNNVIGIRWNAIQVLVYEREPSEGASSCVSSSSKKSIIGWSLIYDDTDDTTKVDTRTEKKPMWKLCYESD